MIGAAVGLGNVWRFPYMVGKFGGGAFVLIYVLAVLAIGIPALMCEWTLGRYTQRGTLGAFQKGGFPGGKYVGYFFFGIVIFATGYYTVAVGWVGYYAIGEIIKAFVPNWNAANILPPEGEDGFNKISFGLQLLMTAGLIFLCGLVLIMGLRKGIEKVSKFIMPTLFIILFVLIIRSVTLPGASEGLKWYIGSLNFSQMNSTTIAAALGQAVFSMSLGGTFMLIYGSYLDKKTNIPKTAIITGLGDTIAGLLAGLAILPAVFAFGLEPSQGPGLIFSTLPEVFAQMPVGWLFGLIFFLGLFGAAFLSDIAAFEVLTAGLTDNTKITRKKAVLLVCTCVFIAGIPPMIHMKIFTPWDLTFGSGMQTLGALLAVITTVWCIKRSDALKEIALGCSKPFPVFLYWWMRLVIPTVILLVGVLWLLENVFEVIKIG